MKFSYRILLAALSIVIMTSRALLQQRLIRVQVHTCFMSTDKDLSAGVKTVGFIGLGLMGDGMARRLLAHDYPLTIWNRSKEKCENLKADYGNLVVVADSPADVIKRSDITFLMLSTPEVTRSAYVGADGLLSNICAGKSVIDCATLAPTDMIWADTEVRARGGRFVEGPVSGSKVPAEKGQLIFMLAGDQILAEEAQPYLALMGKASHFISNEVGSATKMKLIVNGILSNMLACVAEGISITADSGLSSSVLLEVLSQGAMASPLIAMKGPVRDSTSLQSS